jgi:hypothetical protein
MNPNAQSNTMPPDVQSPPPDNPSPTKPPVIIKQAYLPVDEYAWTYYEAQKQARLFFLPYNEFERLAQNKIRDDLTPNMPRVNDGSLAALLNETPMRILAQPFTGEAKVLESIDPQSGNPAYPQPWLQDLINVLWNKEIIPYCNTQAPFFQKQVLALYRSLVYGSCPVYDFFTNRYGHRITDFVLPYIRDVYLEVGKSSDLDSDYIFLDQYYTRLQLDKIIAAGNKVEATGVKSPWDIKAIQNIRDSHVESQKEYLSKNPAERNRPVRSTQIKFTTVFQRGVAAPFDTFYATGNKEDLVLVKQKVNEDPTGDIPIHLLYSYEDLINPYGKGQIEISGGTQNVLDYLTQLHVLANQIGLQPPILIEGDRSMTDLDSMIYSPTQFWFTGGAKVSMMETSNSMIKEFPTAYGLYKNQLISMQGTSTTDIPSLGELDVTKGKTPQAIESQNDKENSHDNYLLSQAVGCFSRVFKSMLNIQFANMQGTDVVRLEADDAMRLTRSGMLPADPGNPNMPATNEVEVDWDRMRGKFDFEINPESSKVKDNAGQVTKLSDILSYVQENPYMLQYIRSTGYSLNLGEVYSQIFTKLGLQNIEKILEPLTAQDKAAAATVPPMVFDKPHIDLKYSDIPATAQQQLLGRVGLNVSIMDVLMGPVLDPNIRGVYNPQDEPGYVQNPVNGPLNPGSAQEKMPQSPQINETVMPKDSSYQPNPNIGAGANPIPPTAQPPVMAPPSSTGMAPTPPSPVGGNPAQPPMAPQPGGAPTAPGLNPNTVNLINQVAQEKGVHPRIATGIVHARALGIPEGEITKWLTTHGMASKPAPVRKAK